MAIVTLPRTLKQIMRRAVSFRDQVAHAVFSDEQPSPPAEVAPSSPEQPPAPPVTTVETSLAQAQRISEERFQAITTLFEQGERWKRAFFEQAGAHSEACFQLEQHAGHLTTALRRAVVMINDLRAKQEEAPIDVEATLIADFAGVAMSYRDRMAAIGVKVQAEEDALRCPGSGQVPMVPIMPSGDRIATGVCPVCRGREPFKSDLTPWALDPHPPSATRDHFSP